MTDHHHDPPAAAPRLPAATPVFPMLARRDRRAGWLSLKRTWAAVGLILTILGAGAGYAGGLFGTFETKKDARDDAKKEDDRLTRVEAGVNRLDGKVDTLESDVRFFAAAAGHPIPTPTETPTLVESPTPIITPMTVKP